MLSSRRALAVATALALIIGAPLLWKIYLPAGWPLDAARHAVGRDFVNLWVAGKLLLEGQAAALFNVSAYNDALHRLFDPTLPPHFWSYPPTSFLLAVPLGVMPYGLALALWTGLGLAAFFGAARIGLAQQPAKAVTLLLLVAPATLSNVVCGQNGFFTAALLAGGFLWRERRPVLAGMCLGLLSYKPHFGIVVVPALLALGAWRTIAAAAATTVALTAASLLCFGVEPWRAFLAVTMHNQATLLEAFNGFFTTMLVSPYSLLRYLGLAHGHAMALQGILAVATIAIVAVLVRRAKSADLVLALVGLGTFAASPYSLTYDLPVMALIIARLALRDRQWTRGEACIYGAAWAVPLAATPLALAGLPLGAAFLVAAFALICVRVVPLLASRPFLNHVPN